jgi:hypothetical protein
MANFVVDESKTLTAHWSDDYYHQSPYSDGEVYRKVWIFKEQDSTAQMNLWMARLSSSKRDSLERLLKRRGFTKGLEALLDLPGLWGGLQLGNVRGLLALRCDEVHALYVTPPTESNEYRK